MQYLKPEQLQPYICSPYAEYKPEPTDVKKRVTAPDTVVVGGVTYHRQKKKKPNVSPTTVVSVRLSNDLIKKLLIEIVKLEERIRSMELRHLEGSLNQKE